VFYKSQSTFSRKHTFPVHCVFDEIHCENCIEQLLDSVIRADSAAEDPKVSNRVAEDAE
jgi:hypothetical protein